MEAPATAGGKDGEVTALLTADEAAERLGICERTLRRLRQKGEIAYIALTERAYHERFMKHHLRGDWFSPHPDILAEIERLNAPTPGASQ